MFLESSGDIRCDPSIEKSFLVPDDINKPILALHAIMITDMKRITIPFSELKFSYSRSSGAGGQNVNKVNSKVTLDWDPSTTTACSQDVIERFRSRFPNYVLNDGQIQISCQESRSQKINQDECVAKLHEKLNSVAIPPKIRKPTKPKRSAVLKRLTGKRKDSEKKRLRRNDHE